MEDWVTYMGLNDCQKQEDAWKFKQLIKTRFEEWSPLETSKESLLGSVAKTIDALIL